MVQLQRCLETQNGVLSFLHFARIETNLLSNGHLSCQSMPRFDGTRQLAHHWGTSVAWSCWSSPCTSTSLSLPGLRTLGIHKALCSLLVVSAWWSQWLPSCTVDQEGCSVQGWATFRSWNASDLCTTTNLWLASRLPRVFCATFPCGILTSDYSHHSTLDRSFRIVCTRRSFYP